MKKLKFILTCLLLISTQSIFAEGHATSALEHANAAAKEGGAGSASNVVTHAEAALDHTLALSITAKGSARNHFNEAAEELRQAIDHGNLGHPGEATSHAKLAAWHIKAGNATK